MKHNNTVRIAFVVAGIAVANNFSASAVQIDLQSAQYHTYVARGEWSGAPFENRTNFAFAPIGDAYVSPNPSGWVECEAAATLFKVSTSAHALEHEIFRGHSEAFAGVEFVFKPVADVSTTLGLSFFMCGQYAWGGNAVSLFDLTTGTTLWNFYDEGVRGGNIAWDYFASGAEPGVNASLTVPTQLYSSHEYRFDLSSWGTSSAPDSDRRFTQISGLEISTQAVPEPSTLALIALTAAGFFYRRKMS